MSISKNKSLENSSKTVLEVFVERLYDENADLAFPVEEYFDTTVTEEEVKRAVGDFRAWLSARTVNSTKPSIVPEIVRFFRGGRDIISATLDALANLPSPEGLGSSMTPVGVRSGVSAPRSQEEVVAQGVGGTWAPSQFVAADTPGDADIQYLVWSGASLPPKVPPRIDVQINGEAVKADIDSRRPDVITIAIQSTGAARVEVSATEDDVLVVDFRTDEAPGAEA